MLPNGIEKILESSEKSLIEVYLELQQQFETKYGENTVILMEIGSFFEVYGVDNGEIHLGKPKEIAEILNIQLTRRNKSIAENSLKNPLLAGFPAAAFDRYVARIIEENKYTIVVVRQTGTPPKITRYIERILSPGVNFDYSLGHEENFVASILVDQNNGLYSVGYASLDVTTGKTFLQEIHSTHEDPTFALCEVSRLLQAYRTSEILLTFLRSEIDEYEVKQYLEIFNTNVKNNHERLKVSYQNELFKQTYVIQSFLTPIEFLDLERNPLTSESLALLLEFVIDHDYSVIQKLEKPCFLSSEAYVYLGNNPLEQLNITARDEKEMTVVKFIDKTTTSMGRRLLRERIFNPITNIEELDERYNLSDVLEDVSDNVSRELGNVYDLERIIRRIQLERLHPFEINFLFDSLESARRILELIGDKKDHAVVASFAREKNQLQTCLDSMKHIYNLDETGKVSFGNITTSIFQPGFNKELDELLAEVQTIQRKIEIIRNKILHVLETHTGKNETEFVEIKQLDKEGHYISLTRSRFALIEENLKTHFVSIDGTVYAFSDFSFKTQTTNVKITAPIIEKFSEEIISLQTKIIATTKELYTKELRKLEQNFLGLLRETANFLSKIDVSLCNNKIAKAYHLVRPTLVDSTNKNGFFEIKDLRHLLVEAREENGIYVPNDITLGSEENQTGVRGVLLYGINSSGKSSFMKSIGIAVILAQSGFFVPASSMRLGIFRELFTRILAKDNFEKGLSSFGVEMMELKNIFNRSGRSSLILGDEISHGTETLSALAIVGATIEYLEEKQALFLFTTHLHQLGNLERIQKLKAVISMHLSVLYNAENDKLIFERKLQPGSGSSIYGLEFAESLHLDKNFLKRAESLRKELAADYKELELLTQKKESKYHKDLYLTECAICKGPVTDTHHIAHQEDADETGHIEHFHKNHKYNLIPLCQLCHHKVHEGTLTIRGFVMTSRGLEIDYEEK